MNDELYYQLLVQQAEAKARYDTITKILQDLNSKKEEIPDTPIGVMIRSARVQLNLSQPELAEKVGYGHGGQVHISRIENGRAIPTVLRLKSFSDVLGIDYNDLYQARVLSLKMKTEQN